MDAEPKQRAIRAGPEQLFARILERCERDFEEQFADARTGAVRNLQPSFKNTGSRPIPN